jgi:Bifunctional DNA primase/polymerase, N-terminal/Primase C terminal 1 (PriCT-1)
LVPASGSGEATLGVSILFHTVLDFAMEYSRLGLAVLPLHYPVRHQDGMTCSCARANCNSPAKHPVGHLVPNGIKGGSTKPKMVKGWFRDSPWNIGIVTGAASGIIPLDIDPRHGGDECLAALEGTNGPLPETWRFLTGGGGEHVIFRHPGGFIPNSAQKIGPGIDVRGDGGYIVAPPSRHITGRDYAISVDHHPDLIPLADPPPWLIELMKSNSSVRVPAEEWRRRIGSAIPEGERNDTLARISGHLLAHRIDPHVCLDIVLSLNVTHCTPSLPEQEILNIVASIARREFAQRATRRKESNRG